MAALTTIALVTSAVAGLGAAVSTQVAGKRAATKTKKERGRQAQETTRLKEEAETNEAKEDAKVVRDKQRRARLSNRKGSSGREGALTAESVPGGGGAKQATNDLIGV